MSIIERALERKKKQSDPDQNDQKQTSGSVIPPSPAVETRIEPATSSVIEANSVAQPAASVKTALDEKPGDAVSGTVEVDLLRLQSLGMITPDMKRSQIAEEYRMIKRPLLNNAAGKGATIIPNGNLIMVTSSVPGEGKTFTSVNLAISIALEMDKTVLLVDADVAKSSVSKALGIKTGNGLVEYLSGEVASLRDVFLRTNIPKLSILPSGKRHDRSTELLASENMKKLLQELSYRYPDRIIVFDSPPLLVTTEASVLANQMGQIVMVVEAERTSKEVLKEAISLIDDQKIIGLVLNKSGQLFGSDYYGSYSNYGYGT